jgi:hypothetical protein
MPDWRELQIALVERIIFISTLACYRIVRSDPAYRSEAGLGGEAKDFSLAIVFDADFIFARGKFIKFGNTKVLG